MSVAEPSLEAFPRGPALMRATFELVSNHGSGQQPAKAAVASSGDGDAARADTEPTQRERLTAVARDAMSQLVTALQAAILDATNASAVNQWRAMGHAFLRWAHDNPVHFQVISSPSLIDVEAAGVSGGYVHIRNELRRLIAAAASEGDIYCVSVEDTLVSTRSFVYGLARMHVDGHFPGWGVRGSDALATMQRLFDSYLFRLRRSF